MKTLINLDNGNLTLNIDGGWMEVTNNTRNGETVCAASATRLVNFNKSDKTQTTRRLLSTILVGLIRNGFLSAAKEVRAIINQNNF